MPTRKRRQSGGAGNSYSFGAAVTPGAPYASEVVRASSCMAADRPGMIAGYSPPGLGGLPGMAGGGRRRRGKRSGSKRSGSKRSGSKRSGSKRSGSKRSGSKRRGRSGKKGRSMKLMRGGRYVVSGAPFPESSSVGPNVYAPVAKLGCNYQGGGGGLGADNLAYAAPTAGFTNNPSSWVGATGAPVLLQAPYDARTMNQACIKTGGGRSRSKRRGSKRSRKH